MSQRWIRRVQTTCIPIFFQKRLKQTKNCLEVVNSFVSVSMVNVCHNLKHLTNYMSQRWIRSVQTTLILILFQKRLKPTKNCLEAANSFVTVSMVKMCHNIMHLTNYKSQIGIKSVQTTLIPVLSQKRLKPIKKCLEVVNSFVSVATVNICQNPKYLTNYMSQSWINSVQTTLIPIFFKKKLK